MQRRLLRNSNRLEGLWIQRFVHGHISFGRQGLDSTRPCSMSFTIFKSRKVDRQRNTDVAVARISAHHARGRHRPERRHDFLEKALTRIPLLAKGEVELSSLPHLLDEGISCHSGVICHFDAGTSGGLDGETMNLREAIEPMAYTHSFAGFCIHLMIAGACSVEYASSIRRNGPFNFQFDGSFDLIRRLELWQVSLILLMAP